MFISKLHELAFNADILGTDTDPYYLTAMQENYLKNRIPLDCLVDQLDTSLNKHCIRALEESGYTDCVTIDLQNATIADILVNAAEYPAKWDNSKQEDSNSIILEYYPWTKAIVDILPELY